MNFSVQNKQNTKGTLYSNLKFWLVHDELEFFPEENPTQNLQIHWDRVEIVKKFLMCIHTFVFLTINSQNFETEYKKTAVDKTLVSNIPKI